MENLKPCPFCGSEEVELHKGHFTVYCIACGAEGARFVSDENAVKGWNHRVPEAAKPQLPPSAWLDPKTCLISSAPGGGYDVPLYRIDITVTHGVPQNEE